MSQKYNNDVVGVQAYKSAFAVRFLDDSLVYGTEAGQFTTEAAAWDWALTLPLRPRARKVRTLKVAAMTEKQMVECVREIAIIARSAFESKCLLPGVKSTPGVASADSMYVRTLWCSLPILLSISARPASLRINWAIQNDAPLSLHERNVMLQFGCTTNACTRDDIIPALYIRKRLHKEWARVFAQGHLERVAHAQSRL